MSKFSSAKDEPEQAKADMYVRPCQICRKVTQTETLMNRGGMCQGCFDAYCQGAQQNRIGLNHGRR